MNKSIYGNAVPISVPTSGSLSTLTDVQITSPTSGQILAYNGVKWTNSTNIAAPVQSVFTRTGNVVSSSGDYNINQITNVSPLASNASVNITSPQDGQILKYNSGTSKWTNITATNDSVYYKQNYTFSTSLTAVANTHYTLNAGGTLSISPLTPGDHIMVTAMDTPVTVNFTGTSFVTNSYLAGSTSNPSFALTLTTLELMCVFNSGQTYYNIVRISQNKNASICTLNGIKISAVSKINDIPDVQITSATNGQALIFNGSQWVNSSSIAPVSSVFGRTGVITAAEGDYSLTQLSDTTLTSPTTNQYLGYNGSQWINNTLINDGSGNSTQVWSSGQTQGTFTIFANQWFNGTIGGLNTSGARTSDFLTITANVYNLDLYFYNDFSGSTIAKKWTIVGANDITSNVYWGVKETFKGTTTTSNDIVLEMKTNAGVLTLRARLIGTDAGPTFTPWWRILNRATGTFTTNIAFSSNNTPATIFYDQGVNNVLLSRLGDVLLSTPSTDQVLKYSGTQWINSTAVTSISLTTPTEFSVSGSPITTTGTLAISKVSQLQNLIYASPNGSSGVPVFRSLVSADIPSLLYVTSVAQTVPSDLTITGSPITSSGTLAITRNSQAQNLFMASPNGSSGVPTYRSILTADLPTANTYYTLVNTTATTPITAIANTYYVPVNGATITIPPLAAGQHIMVTAEASSVSVTFSGTSYISNSYLGTGTSNPLFSLTYATIELICILTGALTYYELIRVSQNKDTSICTLNTVKVAAINNINDIPNVAITSPSSGQVLTYNGSNWSNQFPARIYSSAGLVSLAKVFSDSTTTNASGVFTLSIASASFTNILTVQVTAIRSGSTSANAPVATVQTQSTSSITGIVVQSNTVLIGGQGLTNVGSGIVVYVTVMGN